MRMQQFESSMSHIVAAYAKAMFIRDYALREQAMDLIVQCLNQLAERCPQLTAAEYLRLDYCLTMCAELDEEEYAEYYDRALELSAMCFTHTTLPYARRLWPIMDAAMVEAQRACSAKEWVSEYDKVADDVTGLHPDDDWGFDGLDIPF